MNTQSDRIAQNLINVKYLLQNFTEKLGGLGQPPLKGWLTDSTLSVVFGNDYDTAILSSILSAWNNCDFSNLPTIEVISSDILGNANSGYSQQTNTISLADNFINNAQPHAIENIILEEIGHYINAQINTVDPVWDEGAVFADLIRRMGTARSGHVLKPKPKMIFQDLLSDISPNSLFIENYSNILKSEIKCVSLDFFDTCLIRRVDHPIDLFYILGEELQKKGYLKKNITNNMFAQLRVEAEQQARIKAKKNHDYHEVSLLEIYQEFPQDMIEVSLRKMVNFEVELEIELSTFYLPVVWLIIEAKKAGKELIIVSDTYFSSLDIRKFLEQCKYFKEMEINWEVFTSLDYRTGKGDKLFDLVIKHIKDKYGYEAHQICHIGDNYISDCEKPFSKGIKTGFLPNGDSFFWTNIYGEEQYLDLECKDINSIKTNYFLTSIRAKQVHFCALNELDKASFFRYGSQILGPIFSGFSTWVYDSSKKIELDGITFFMREGLFLSDLCNFVYDNHDKSSSNIDIFAPIYVSRRTLLQAKFQEVNEEILNQFILGVKDQTVGEFISLLGLTPQDFESDFSQIDFNFDDLTSQVKTNLISLICNSEFLKNKIYIFFTLKRKNLLKHIENSLNLSLKLGDTPYKLGVVDVGWSATIQNMLNQILQEEGYNIQLYGLYLMTTDTAKQRFFANQTYSWGYLCNFGQPVESYYLLIRTPEIFEQSSTAVEYGSLIDYDNKGKPILGVSSLSKKQKDEIKEIQKGIKLFHYLYQIHIKNIENLSDENYIKQLRKIALRSIISPLKEEIKMFINWQHDENMVAQSSHDIIPQKIIDIAPYLTLDKFRQLSMKDVYWPFAALSFAQPELANYHKYALLNPQNLPQLQKQITANSSVSLKTNSQEKTQEKPIVINHLNKVYVEYNFDNLTEPILSLKISPIKNNAVYRLSNIFLTSKCKSFESLEIINTTKLFDLIAMGKVTLNNINPITKDIFINLDCHSSIDLMGIEGLFSPTYQKTSLFIEITYEILEILRENTFPVFKTNFDLNSYQDGENKFEIKTWIDFFNQTSQRLKAKFSLEKNSPLLIKGWCLPPSKDSNTIITDILLVLINKETTETKTIKLNQTSRKDVNQIYEIPENIDCGFELNVSNFNIPEGDYNMFLCSVSKVNQNEVIGISKSLNLLVTNS